MNVITPVCVVHGHGGSNHGHKSEGGEFVEAVLARALAGKVVALAYPLVHLATADDIDLSPAEVRVIAQAHGCRVALELHFDGAGPARHGPLFCYRGAEARALGCEICSQLGGDWSAWEMPDPKWPRASLLAAGYDGFPVCVLEVENLDSALGLAKLRRAGALDTMAALIAVGIESWYKNSQGATRC